MAKVTAAEMDKVIMLISRMTWRQLDRLDTLVGNELIRKAKEPANMQPETKEATP